MTRQAAPWLLAVVSLALMLWGAMTSAAKPAPDAGPAKSESKAVQALPDIASGAAADAIPGSPPLPLPARDPDACRLGAPDEGPEMVVVEGGRFWMGSPAAEEGRNGDEGPRHLVAVQPFALGRCEVTVGEFRRFIEDRAAQGQPYVTSAEGAEHDGCDSRKSGTTEFGAQKGAFWQRPGFAQHDDQPVVCVSFMDAQAYIAWLNRRTGARYRLPTEAEWEFAARAGTITPRYWPEAAAPCDHANVADRRAAAEFKDWKTFDCDDRHVVTAPVARYAPNGTGTYDVLGNVFEWTQDCWHENYEGAPLDGRAWESQAKGDCELRVVRGGSWLFGPEFLRSAYRNWNDPGVAIDTLGFRLARTLP